MPDEKKRLAVLEKAEATLMADAPVAPIYYYANIYLKAPELRGVADNAMDYQLVRDMFFEKEGAQ